MSYGSRAQPGSVTALGLKETLPVSLIDDVDGDDDDDDDDLDSLMGEIEAEAVSLSKWCSNINPKDAAAEEERDATPKVCSGGAGDSSGLGAGGGGERDYFREARELEEQRSALSKMLEEPAQPRESSAERESRELRDPPRAPSRGMQLRDIPADSDRPAHAYQKPLKSSDAAYRELANDVLDSASAGLGPLRLMAWGAAFVIVITVLAIVTTPTGRSAVARQYGMLPKDSVGTNDLELMGSTKPSQADVAAAAMDLMSQPRGRGRRGPRLRETADSDSQPQTASEGIPDDMDADTVDPELALSESAEGISVSAHGADSDDVEDVDPELSDSRVGMAISVH